MRAAVLISDEEPTIHKDEMPPTVSLVRAGLFRSLKRTSEINVPVKLWVVGMLVSVGEIEGEHEVSFRAMTASPSETIHKRTLRFEKGSGKYYCDKFSFDFQPPAAAGKFAIEMLLDGEPIAGAYIAGS